MNLTPNQKQAMEINKENCLVSAAAGSGKTAVLTQRVVRLLSENDDNSNVVNVDEIVVATFTKLSATEMIHRIGGLLNDKINKLKHDASNITDLSEINKIQQQIEKYELQKLQLPNAKIATIDSICKTLIQENFQSLNISSTTKIIDPKQSELIEKEVAIDFLDELHNPKSDLAGLVDMDDLKTLVEFTCNKDDRNLIEMLTNTYEYIRSFPHPLDYLDKVEAIYSTEMSTPANFFDNLWVQPILLQIEDAISYCKDLAEFNTIKMTDCPVVEEKYGKALNDDFNKLDEIISEFAEKNNKSAFDKLIAKHKKWEKLGSITAKTECDVDVKNICSETRTAIKKIIKKIVDKYELILDQSNYRTDLKVASKHITTFFKILRKLYECIEDKKRELEVMDFANVEHYMLELLTTKNGDGGYDKSPTAIAISGQLQYILVDECQDINRVQNEIFNLLSDNKENIYMVGDVKQSIYKFRKAAPEIFIEKKSNSETKTILLQENFRSRDVVCNTINHIFTQIMSEKLGDINYNDDELLKVGRKDYFKNENAIPELHIINLTEDEDSETAGIIEAQHIAQTIKQMVDDRYQVYDGENKSRDCDYKDFAILVRTKNEFKEVYEKEFKAKNITINCNFESDFLREYDVLVALNLLKVISNPLQDVPLLSVIMSPLFGFSPDLVSLIKMKNKGRLWTAIINFDKPSDIDKELDITPDLYAEYTKTCKDFIDFIAVLREKASILTVSKLLQYIFDATDFLALMSAKNDIKLIKTNINYFLNQAKEYDNFSGISGFIRRIDGLIEKDIGIDIKNEISSNANAVKLMTIHASKGLEFPICILTNCSREFYDKDSKSNYTLDTDLGLGFKMVSEDKYQRHNSLQYESITLKRKRDDYSEALRVLYVALTRAKEKLIMVGSYKKACNEVNKIINFNPQCNKITPYEIFSYECLSDWLVSSLLSNQKLPNVIDDQKFMIDTNFNIGSNDFRFCMLNSVLIKEDEINDDISTEDVKVELDSELIDKIKEQIDFVYPYDELTKTPAKTTVTNLAKSDFAKTTGKAVNLKSNLIFNDEISENEFTPAQLGTFLHTFMEFADFDIASNNLEREISRLVSENFLTQPGADTLDRDKINTFFASDTYKLMKENKVKREYDFYFEIDAHEINENVEPGKYYSLVQGIADCIVFEEDKITIIDYKTNRTKSGKALVEQYQMQMELYSKEISKKFNKPTEAYLYSLTLGKALKVKV